MKQILWGPGDPITWGPVLDPMDPRYDRHYFDDPDEDGYVAVNQEPEPDLDPSDYHYDYWR